MSATNAHTASGFHERYSETLQRYLLEGGEAVLLSAYDLGREALAEDISILDVVGLHRECLDACMKTTAGADRRLRMSADAGKFLDEVLSPFEMARLGGRDANFALRRLFDLLEQEAKRVACTLHDESSQLLATVYLELNEISKEAPPDIAERMQAVTKHLDEIVDQLRQLSHELRPHILDQLGLGAALEFLAKSMAKRTGLAIYVDYQLEARLAPALETSIYRICQEALVNVHKHAHANQVEIRLSPTTGSVEVLIEDDGIGLGVEGPKVKRGVGLISIEERVAALSGDFTLSAPPDKGCRLQVKIPI